MPLHSRCSLQETAGKIIKIALQLGLIPGSNTKDKAQWAADHGVEGIEVSAFGGGLTNMKRDADRCLQRGFFIGFMAYECGISGDSDEEKAANLAKSLE